VDEVEHRNSKKFAEWDTQEDDGFINPRKGSLCQGPYYAKHRQGEPGGRRGTQLEASRRRRPIDARQEMRAAATDPQGMRGDRSSERRETGGKKGRGGFPAVGSADLEPATDPPRKAASAAHFGKKGRKIRRRVICRDCPPSEAMRRYKKTGPR